MTARPGQLIPVLRRTFRHGLPLAFALLLTCVLTGCGHYRLGTGGQTTFRTLYVAPVQNDSALPQAVAPISTALREAFLRDGRVTLVESPEAAEAVLTVQIDRFGREIATVLPNDTGLARKFDLTLYARATLRDTRSGQLLFTNRPLVARRQIFTDNPTTAGRFDNQLQAEFQSVPLLAETLAAAASRAVLDVW